MKRSIMMLFLCVAAHSFAFKLGIENVSKKYVQQLNNAYAPVCRIGLISNQTGKDQRGQRSLDVLRDHGAHVHYIFAPEHGFDGVVGAEKIVSDGTDKKTGIPIVSLYGAGTGKKMDPKYVTDIDVLIFDIQDCGMRHYTYISTLFYAMKSAIEHKKPIIVLDRPNLLGNCISGPIVDLHIQSQQSFIAIAPIPLRHAMTIGEIAHYFNTHLMEKAADLRVVKMSGYKRTMLKPLIAPLSPNIASEQSVYGYSFLGLLGEVAPFDVGVGTPEAFQCILLPTVLRTSDKKWDKVKEILKKYGIESTHFAHMHPAKKIETRGLKLSFGDVQAIDSFSLLIDLLSYFKEAHIPITFSRFFDRAVGMPAVREMIDGKMPREELIKKIATDLRNFVDNSAESFFYAPRPRVAT